jgi:DNA primase small subunit
MFLKYYTECFSEIGIPPSFEKREFAALLFRNRAMIRHKSFTSVRDLECFLQADVPSDVYCSSALYEQPGASEMSAKGWIAADLIFDIDADHIPTSCDRTHDEWTCAKCGFLGKGIAPEKCPACGGEKFDENTWVCEVCLDSAKSETVRLLDMLINDFGVAEEKIHVFFSGHRGYHIHVTDEAMQRMETLERKEMVDYVFALGFDRVFQRIDENSARDENKMWPLSVGDHGWRGRIAKGIHDFLRDASPQDYADLGIKKSIGIIIDRNKDSILKSLKEGTSSKKFKGLSAETWGKARALIVDHVLENKIAHVDTVVTTDIHRLIRLTGTLHNKTGMKKVEFPASAIRRFDPFTSAIAFKEGTTTICVSKAPKFRLGNETYGPYNNEEVKLPTAAAMLLICKNRAEVTAQNVR